MSDPSHIIEKTVARKNSVEDPLNTFTSDIADALADLETEVVPQAETQVPAEKKETETPKKSPAKKSNPPLPPPPLKKSEDDVKKGALSTSKEVMATFSINNYTTKFDAYPPELTSFAEENNIQLPLLTTMRGQALALMAQPEIRGKPYLRRQEADAFFTNIGMETKDAIQQFNKATGVKRIAKKGVYSLAYPFECDKVDIDKRKGVSIDGDRNTFINGVKEWWKKNLLDIPNDDWQIGHLDPTIDDASEKNLAYQPPIQGKYRNRFKWDALFHKMWPTAAELAPKIDSYYTEKEQRMLYESLKQKFQ